MTKTDIQTKLDDLYLEYLKKILSDNDLHEMINNYTLSSPQFLDIYTPRANYLLSDYQIVLIGKETNGWFNKREREEAGLVNISSQFNHYMEELKKIYYRHNIGENYRSSIFTFIDLFTETIRQRRNVGIILTELIRLDYMCTHAPFELALRLAYDNNYILRKEIGILNPNALVFLTGPEYDEYIKYTYPKASFLPYKGFDKRQVAIIQGIPGIEKSIRIYHPDAHKYQGTEFRYDMVETISEVLGI